MDSTVVEQLKEIQDSVTRENELLEKELGLNEDDLDDSILVDFMNLDIDDIHNNAHTLTTKFSPLMRDYVKMRQLMDCHMKNTCGSLELAKTSSQVVELVQKILNLYHFDHRDCLLDDYVWKKHDSSSLLFSMKKNMIVFANSIHENDISDEYTKEFIDCIVECAKRYVHKDSTTTIKWNYKYDEKHDVNWALIILQ